MVISLVCWRFMPVPDPPGALFSFVVHEIAECTGAHVRSYRNGCFPGFRNSVWIFMSDHLDQAAVDGISVSLPIRPSFSRVDTLLFFSSRRPRNCYSILNMLEFIDNGYLVALFILVSRNCESKLGIGMWTRACKLICVGYIDIIYISRIDKLIVKGV